MTPPSSPDHTTMARVSLLVSLLPHHCGHGGKCQDFHNSDWQATESAARAHLAAILSLACQVLTIRARMGGFELIILSLCFQASVFALLQSHLFPSLPSCLSMPPLPPKPTLLARLGEEKQPTPSQKGSQPPLSSQHSKLSGSIGGVKSPKEKPSSKFSPPSVLAWLSPPERTSPAPLPPTSPCSTISTGLLEKIS